MKKRFLTIFILCMSIMSTSAFAHSGRTDSSGGHRDNKNKSGLGSYHYHCGGYPPHLHSNGVCPYKSKSTSSSSKSSSSSSKSTSNSSTSSTVSQVVYATGITAINIPSDIDIGGTSKLEASVYPSNAKNKTITWESSDTNVIEVSSTGILKAVGIGTARIIAKTSNGVSKKFTIKVNEVMAKSINIIKPDTKFLISDTQVLICDFYPVNTTNKTVEWSSSDESVISVSENGKITANNIGKATITATHKELTSAIEIEVKPIDAKSIEFILPNTIKTDDNGAIIIKKDSNVELKVELKPENTTFKEIEWNISDKNVATIDENGVITPISNGKAIVTATAKSGIRKEIEIEVVLDNTYAAGALGFAVIATGVIWYLRKRKKRNVNI